MLPKPQTTGDFLKANLLKPLLGKNGQATATIEAEPEPGKYGVNVPVKIGKEVFVLTLSEKGRDYAKVANTLGLNAQDWEGKKLILGLREGLNKDEEPTDYVTVVKVG